MKKAIITACSSLFFCAVLSISAFAQELMVGGEAVGIQIRTEGVLVAELAEVETPSGTVCPAKEAGLEKGDFITEIDGQHLSTAVELVDSVSAKCGECVELTVVRNEKTFKREIQPAQSAEDQWLLGIWLRDGVSGVGTLTYMDPETGSYGALGHSISDAGSGIVLPISEGSISDAEIVSINRGAAGSPGELNGCTDVYKILGTVEKNTVYGIFGRLEQPINGKMLETGQPTIGKASIVSTVQGRETKEYQVEISRVCKDPDGSHMVITVTDPELLGLTGGIVQAMSGSPIIQNGKLVGAVTHVLVNDPTKGYGIFIDQMLDAAG